MGNLIELNDVFKRPTNDLDKQIPPEETVRRFRKKLAGIDLDLLEETVRIDNGRLDIPVYFSVCGKDAMSMMGTEKQMGKGGTEAQAEASAVMELVERFSLFSFMNNPDSFILKEYREIRDRAMSLESLAISVQDENSADIDSLRKIFETLPQRWCMSYDLSRKKDVLVPFDWFYSINQFNGSSAGNCKEEAILQGLCEVIERHVSCLVSRKRLKVPLIDPDSVTNPLARELIGKFRRANIRLYLHDLSLGMNIPTVSALAYDPVTFPDKSEIVWTAGTCTDPEKALVRALTEVAQLGGDFNTGSKYVASGLPKLRDIGEADFLINDNPVISIDTLPEISDQNIRTEIENCILSLEKQSMNVMVVDVTNSQLELPAFYVIVPGAHFRERAENASLAMFIARLVCDTQPPLFATERLKEMERLVGARYYTRFYLGLSCLSLARLSDAEKYLRDAVDLGPCAQDIPLVYSYLGSCLKDLGRYRDAIKVLEKAMEYDDERTDIYNLMGFCFFREKEYEKAIACFKRVIDIDPSSAIDYANIASNYRKLGRIEEAIQYYKLALELDPSIDFARENLKELNR